MKLLLFSVVLVLLITVVVVIEIDAAGSATSTLDWNAVPATPVAADAYNTETVGACMCDLTVGVCDANCCCDPDCNGNTAAFTGCAKESGGTRRKLWCIDENPATEIVGMRDSKEIIKKNRFGQDSLCIVGENVVESAGITKYFSLPDQTARSALVAPAAAWPATTTTAAGSNTFKVGDLLPIAHAVVSGASYLFDIPPANKYFRNFGASLPGSSSCDTDAKLRFLENSNTGSSCSLSGATLATQCAAGGALNVDQFRYIAFTRPDHDISSFSFLAPVNVRFINDDTGALMESTSTVPVFQEAVTPGSGSQPPITVVTTFDGTNCINGVAGTRLSILYSQTPEGLTLISEATLVVRVKPLRAPNANNLYPVSSASRFTTNAAVYALSNDAPIQSENSKAGSPGYIRGKRINAGYNVSNPADAAQTAVYSLPKGFEIPFAGDCASARFGAVPFMHDVSSASCSMTVTQAALQTLCTSGSLATLEGFLGPATCGGAACPANISKIVTRIGVDGEASGLNVNDWLTVQGFPIPDATGTWDNTRHQCNNILTGFHWTFGVARAGTVYNAQDIIVSAKVEPIEGTWVYNAASGGIVRFNFKVSFVRMPEGGEYYRKPIVPPSLFPAVDEDVFYPFRRPDA